MDEWFEVPSYPALEITRTGRVRAKAVPVIRKSRWGKDATYRFRQLELRHGDQHGYPVVRARRTGYAGPIYVHRLMALTFVPGHVEGFHVNHINGIKADFRPENLEWVPNEENVKHAWKNSLTGLRGEESPTHFLTWKKVEAIRRALACGVNVNTIAILSDVANETIRRIKSGAAWNDAHGRNVLLPDAGGLSVK